MAMPTYAQIARGVTFQLFLDGAMNALHAAALLVVLALVACGSQRHEAREGNSELLDRAIAAAGGEVSLDKAQRLRWSGDADVHAGGRDIALSVRSDIVPFGKVRSETWLRDKGPSTLRVMELDGTRGWLTRDGKREVMPEAMARNEYAQFGTYGLMRLVTLRKPGIETVEAGKDAQGLVGLRTRYPGLPDAVLWFDARAHLVALSNVVESPDGNGTTQQRFDFSGAIESNGVRWPRSIRITQDGKPFFELTLNAFEALPANQEPPSR